MRHRTLEDNNFYHLVWDIAWFGVAWVTVTRFLTVYAIRVGATPTEIGWITAGPPIGMALASVFSVWWRARFPDSMRAIAIPALLFRFNFLLLAFTPLLPVRWQPLWLVLAVTLPSLPQGISNVIFIGVLKESTPNGRLSHLLGRRALIVNITLATAALVFGMWLEMAPYPANYAVMFAFAFGAAMFSQWHLMRVQPLQDEAVMPVTAAGSSPLADPAFRGVLALSAVGHIAFFSVAPVLALRLVSELGANEGFMALFSVVELMAAAGVAFFIGQIVARIGHRRMIGLALLGTAVAAVVAGLAPSLSLVLIAGAFTGAGWSTAEIGMITYMTEHTPTRDAARYTRMYSQIVWLSIFIAPFIGTTLAEFGVSLSVILLMGAGLRLVAGLIALDFVAPRQRAQPSEKHVQSSAL